MQTSAAQMPWVTSQEAHLERDGARAALQLPRVPTACLELHLQAMRNECCCCPLGTASVWLPLAMSNNKAMLCVISLLCKDGKHTKESTSAHQML